MDDDVENKKVSFLPICKKILKYEMRNDRHV